MQSSTSSVTEIILDTRPLNTSVSEVKPTNTKTLNQVQLIAEKLTDALRNPSRHEYYCKVAWRLPEHRIWFNLEAALRGRAPERLFSYLCSKDMAE